MKIDSPQVLVAVLALMGGLLAYQNLDLPLVRNSLVYAKIAFAISDHGFLGSSQYAYNKALGFSVLSWPLVAWFGANAGLKIASFIGTVLFMAVIPVFLKRLPGMGGKGQSEFRKTVLVLTLFNPLVAYQFMSAYPDALFAALTLGAIIFLDRMLSKDADYLDAPAFAVLALAAVWVKHHGLIIVPIAGVFVLFRLQFLKRQWLHERNRFVGWGVSLAVLFVVLWAAKSGLVPSFNWKQNQGNFLGGEDRVDIIADNVLMFTQYLWVSLGFMFPLVLGWQNYPGRREWLLLPFILILPILYYEGSKYNIRYFLVAAPLLAWLAAASLRRLAPLWRKSFMAAFVLFNAFAIFYYNHPAFYVLARPYIQLPEYDNLRVMGHQGRQRRNLDMIRENLPSHDNTLVYLSNYYKGEFSKIWERAGLYPPGTTVHYARKWDHDLIKKFGLNKAVIFEYVGIGRGINGVEKDKKIKVKKIHDNFFLLDPKAPQ